MTSFKNFVVEGKIGQLFLGITREETLKLLGEPPDWVGKPPNIGFQCESYEQSDVWIYYRGCAGVHFRPNGAAYALIVYLDKIMNCPTLFADWSIKSPTLGEWREALMDNNICFLESKPQNSIFWMVASETCAAYGLPSDDEQPHDVPVQLLVKFSTVEDMKRDFHFLFPD